MLGPNVFTLVLGVLGLLPLVQYAASLRLGKPAPSSGIQSFAHRFPEDVFAQPAYRVKFDDAVISNETASQLLDGPADRGLNVLGQDTSSNGRPFVHHQLMRVSPTSSYLCSLTEPMSNIAPASTLTLTPSNLLSERHRVIESGLSLLSPLKGTCLYHTLDWFTYSLCFGEAIRQFRALDKTIGPGRIPAQDPNQHAYVLGRWRNSLEVVGGQLWTGASQAGASEEENEAEKVASSLGISTEEAKSTSLSSATDNRLSEMLDDSDDDNGTELMQIMRFVSTEPEQRYLSQVWSEGTLCDINNEPRTVEVQYHCVPGLSSSRIALTKETTTCNYIMIVETPLTCKEEQLRVGRESNSEQKRSGAWQCRRIVDHDTASISGGPNAVEAADEKSSEGEQLLESLTEETSKEESSEDAEFEDPNVHTQTPLDWADAPDPLLSSGQYFVLGIDEAGNVIVEETRGGSDHVQDTQRRRDAGDEDQQGDGPQGLEGDFDALFQKFINKAEGDGLFGGEGQENRAEVIELQLDEEDLQNLAGWQTEGGGIGVNAEDLQTAIARALETELNKLKARKQRGGQSEGGTKSEDTAGDSLLARLDKITDSLLEAAEKETPELPDGDEGAAKDQPTQQPDQANQGHKETRQAFADRADQFFKAQPGVTGTPGIGEDESNEEGEEGGRSRDEL